MRLQLRAGGQVRPLRRRRQARPHRALLDLDGLRGIVVCPSNPFVSVAPILAVPGVRAALDKAKAPRVAVTPIVGGQAIKGPAAKMLAELGHDVSALGVARYYKDWVDGFVLDAQDAALARESSTGHEGAGRRHHDAKRR